MPRAKTKTKNEDLARIRNNQRRSRAKRLDYIRQLEEKARKYDEITASANSPSQEDFRKLQTENAWMRGLLATLDVDFNPLDAPPGSILDLDPNISTSIEQPFASDLVDEQPVAYPLPSTFSEQWNILGYTRGYMPELLSHTADLMAHNIGPFSPFNDNSHLTSWDPLPPECCAAPCHHQKPEVSPAKALANGNTTLCSLACQWVIQCNAKGVELDVLYFRMERGFRQGDSPLEGCRVDNQVLLSVLTEIS